MIGGTELLIIVAVALVLLFGAKKIGEIGRSLGKVGAEYKKGKMEAEKELKELQEEPKQ